MICPSCRQDAPTILKGMEAFCTACGAPRSLTSVPGAVNVAGQPSKVGGGVARVMGWLILIFGVGMALIVGSIFQAIFTGGIVGYVLGVPIALFSGLLALGLLLSGNRLRKEGEDKSRGAREQAVQALAARNRGVLTPAQVAKALALPEAEADAFLTELAKRPDGRVSLEVDDNGTLQYHFRDLLGPSGVRVAVDPPKARIATPFQPSKVVDAELIDEDEIPIGGARRQVSR